MDTDVVCNWLESLLVTQGPAAGQPLELMPWQREFISGLLQPRVFTAALSIARGNGKSTLVGGLAAAAVAGPMAVPGAEVVIVASSVGQARIAFQHAARFLAPMMDGGRKIWRMTDSMALCEIRHLPTGIRLVAKSSDPDTAHGLAPSLVLADEPARWKTGRSESLLAALETAMGKIGQEKIIALGTRSADPGHWFETWLQGEADYALNYSYVAEDDAAIYSEDALLAANPSLPYMPTLRAAIDGQIERIKRSSSPRDIAAFKSLRLNQGVDEVYRMALLSAAEWRACEVAVGTEPARAGPSCWGIDLGGTAAMSAIACYWPMTGWLEVLAALPAEPDLAARGEADGVADLYCQMEARGELTVLPGRTISVARFLSLADEKWGSPACVVSDRWREGELLDALAASGIPPAHWQPRGQGFKDQSDDIRGFERAVAEGHVRTPQSLLMRNAVGGCVTVADPAGNRKIAKGSAGFRIAKHRDDAAVAAVQAVAEGRRAYPDLSASDVSRKPAPAAAKVGGIVF